MKHLFITISIFFGLLLAGCGSGNSEHSHGEDAGHSHGQESQTEQHSSQETEEEHGHPHPGDQQEQQEESEHSHGEDSDHQHNDEIEESGKTGSGAVTKWTDETELFMEYPEIIVGRETTFAVHLTRLSDFKPLSNSTVRFTLQSEQGAEVSVTETEVQIPGIYGPDLTFDQAGRYDMTITISGMVNDTLQVDGIPVYNSADEIPLAHEEENPNLIVFLKEQQWNIPFGTREATGKTLTRTVEAHGEIQPAQSSEAVISAPFSGIILPSLNESIPVVGQQVSEGSSVVVLNPSIQSPGGENYARQFVNAQSQLELARESLERSERLYQNEAIPKVELEEARIEYRQAAVRFQTISEIIQIDTASVNISGNTRNSYRIELKSPIRGTVVESYVAPGMQVKAGEPLFHIAGLSEIWLKAHFPASRRGSISRPATAVFTVQGSDRRYDVEELNGRLISMGNTIDSETRTLSLIYELNNPGNGLQSGLFAEVFIDTEKKENVLAIPQSALIEEEGDFVVFVQVGGEAFVKRSVTTGISNRGWVEITSGLNQGEHVVTQNAYQVKLASLSSEVPEHGHAH